MNRVFLKKLKEACFSVFPITLIIVILNFAISPMDKYSFGSFIVGAVLLVTGTALYSLGVDAAIEPIGEHIGYKISHTKNVVILLLAVFLIGCFVTIAEPDLTVLAGQVSIDSKVLILTVSLGVGIFMIIAMLRMILRINLNVVLAIFYGLTFVLLIFVDKSIIPLAFDSGGVTTGPITVPFIMTLSAGISAVIGGSKSQENSFGTIGICSIGPIAVILILSLIMKTESYAELTVLTEMNSAGDIFLAYLKALPVYLKEVGIALAPITAFFLIMQVFFIKLPSKRLVRILIGILYTYIGLTLFLTGVNVGFMATGTYIGGKVAEVNRYLIIPIGMVVGAFIVLAEPAIHILNKQVEEITGSMISRKTMFLVLMFSMSLAVGASMLRVATGISMLYIILPGYFIAIILSFFVPKIFTGIAFDSGGVASGPMTATFLLPFAMGACDALGGDILSDAFGTIGTVALVPLIVLQILGLIYKIKNDKKAALLKRRNAELLAREGEIIEFDYMEES
ncbi:MAG: DUF1538 domain-containing protein [Christensenellales bacterium]